MLASELPIELYFERFNFRKEKNWTSGKDFDMEINGFYLPGIVKKSITDTLFISLRLFLMSWSDKITHFKSQYILSVWSPVLTVDGQKRTYSSEINLKCYFVKY